MSMRIRRLAAELRMRRRRLDAIRNSPPWPGKDPAWRSEQARYDQYLVVAGHMLEVPVPEWGPGRLLAPEARAVLEDRLAHAGLDVMAPPGRPRAMSWATATSSSERGTGSLQTLWAGHRQP